MINCRCDTPLQLACFNGYRAVVYRLLRKGVAVNDASRDGVTPLYIACLKGHGKITSLLLDAGAAVNQADNRGFTPLHIACHHGHHEIANILLAVGAAVNQSTDYGFTPFKTACNRGHLACVQLVSSYGGVRSQEDGEPWTAEELAIEHADVHTWLVASRAWSTPLHHLTVIDGRRARALLRAGADIHATAADGGPTPLSLARRMRTAGDARDGSAAHLVLEAYEAWSPHTHALFPEAARKRAVALLLIGRLLAREPRFGGVAGAIVNIWEYGVMPRAITRYD
jgi:hypothetical protein